MSISSCYGKECFSSLGKALLTAQIINRRKKKTYVYKKRTAKKTHVREGKVRPYLCSHCGQYHLTGKDNHAI